MSGHGGPATVNPHLEMGIAALKKHEYARAEKMFTKAIAMQPKLVSIYDQRARAYVKMERLDKALDDVTNIVRLEPGNALGYLRTGRIMWKQGNKEGALKTFRLGKSKAQPGDKNLPELEKCFDDAVQQLGPAKKQAARPLAENAVVVRPTIADIGDLPAELLASVFSFLALKERLRSLRICRSWRTAGLEDKRLWQVWDLSAFPKAGTNIAIQMIAMRAKSLLRELIVPSAKLLDDKGLGWLMIQKCSGLKSIVLRDNTRLSPKGLGSVVKLAGPALREINFGDVRAVDDVGIGAILRFCPSLETLILSGACPFTAAPFAMIKVKLPLKKLSVTGIASFTDAAFAGILGSCAETLEDINLSDCANITKLSLVNLAGATTLVSLSLNKINFGLPTTISIEDAMVGLADRCKKLAKFSLGFCPQMTDQALENLVSFAGDTLTDLDLNHNGRISDAGARAIVANCVALQNLNLSWCPRITGDALLDLVVGCRRTLRSLSLASSPSVSDALIEAICTQCQNLDRLDVAKCGGISTLGVSSMLRSKVGRPWNFICLDDCTKVASEVLAILARNMKQTGGTLSARMT